MEEVNHTDGVAVDQDENLSQSIADASVAQVIQDILNIYIPLCLSLCGIVSNLLNMVIFGKLGLKDSMSINVFALSLSDFLTTLVYAVVCLCYLTDKLYPTNNIDAFALGYIPIGWVMNAMYLSSCWVTAVVTIERCVCVVFPFKVKQIFTRFRSVTIIVIIYCVTIGVHVPLYVIHKMEWVDRPICLSGGINMTHGHVRVFTTFFVEETARIEMIFDTIIGLALTDVSFGVVILCTFWMIRGLKTSSKIRKESRKSTEVDTHKSTLSNKERRLVKVALALAVTLTACGLPRVLTVIIENSIPNAKVGSIKGYVIILWAVTANFATIGCSITIFVYLTLNANYRNTFYRLLH